MGEPVEREAFGAEVSSLPHTETTLTSSISRSLRSRRRAQQLRILKRCLCISILDLGMNLPNYLLRLYLTIVSDEELEELNSTRVFLWLQDVSQLLYFAQVILALHSSVDGLY